eukprot:m.1035825 g.1035825  ORF g.1035825 m.1035825 type:complete len:280 (-) comp24138_c3_seq36:2377-3216(-)
MSGEDDDFPRVVALYDYVARSDQELTFRAGDVMVITEILSDDWFEGNLGDVGGLIAAAYVRHAPDWREKARMQPRHTPPSPQLSRRKASPTGSRRSASPKVVSVGGSHSPRSSPLTQRRMDNALPVAHHDAARTHLHDDQHMQGFAMPGMRGADAGFMGHRPSGADRRFQGGASEEELIKAKPIPMQPDRPDLAKALNIRNQAARVGGPQKQTGPNELARHLAQLKTKQMYKTRGQDPQTAELQARLRQQAAYMDQRAREPPVTELQRRVTQIAQRSTR